MKPPREPLGGRNERKKKGGLRQRHPPRRLLRKVARSLRRRQERLPERKETNIGYGGVIVGCRCGCCREKQSEEVRKNVAAAWANLFGPSAGKAQGDSKTQTQKEWAVAGSAPAAVPPRPRAHRRRLPRQGLGQVNQTKRSCAPSGAGPRVEDPKPGTDEFLTARTVVLGDSEETALEPSNLFVARRLAEGQVVSLMSAIALRLFLGGTPGLSRRCTEGSAAFRSRQPFRPEYEAILPFQTQLQLGLEGPPSPWGTQFLGVSVQMTSAPCVGCFMARWALAVSSLEDSSCSAARL